MYAGYRCGRRIIGQWPCLLLRSCRSLCCASNTVQWPKLPGYTYLRRAVSSRRKKPRQDVARVYYARWDRKRSVKITARRASDLSFSLFFSPPPLSLFLFFSLYLSSGRPEKFFSDGKNLSGCVCDRQAGERFARVLFFPLLLFLLLLLSSLIRRFSTHVVLRSSLQTYLRSHKILKANATRGRIVRKIWIKALAHAAFKRERKKERGREREYVRELNEFISPCELQPADG